MISIDNRKKDAEKLKALGLLLLVIAAIFVTACCDYEYKKRITKDAIKELEAEKHGKTGEAK